MMTPKRPHLLDSLRFFRYGFLLCLVPMVQALFRFDMEGLLIALWQDAAILAVCLVGWGLTDKAAYIQTALPCMVLLIVGWITRIVSDFYYEFKG